MDLEVVVPARNEAATVAGVVAPLVERGLAVVVVDSASDDDTGAVAAGAGARVVRVARPGKGLALRTGVEATTAAFVVFCDADLTSFDPQWVDRLAAPLGDPAVMLVKPIYARPPGGGRVTELMARPLLRAFAPELARIRQPLGGEYAARRSALLECGFPDGYGVEIALLLQIADAHGPAAVAEVDLPGPRLHRNRGLEDLSTTASEVLEAALALLDGQGRLKLGDNVDVAFTRPLSPPVDRR